MKIYIYEQSNNTNIVTFEAGNIKVEFKDKVLKLFKKGEKEPFFTGFYKWIEIDGDLSEKDLDTKANKFTSGTRKVYYFN